VDHFRKVGRIAPGGVHGRELHVRGVALRVPDRFNGDLQHLFPRFLELELDMDVRARDKGVDARFFRFLDRIPRGIDVIMVCPWQAGYLHAFNATGDCLHRLEVAF